MASLISVIIPVYGVEQYIEKCARSIFEQTYQNLDIIFVNDCTLDNSIEILKNIIGEYPDLTDKIRILTYPNNKGLAGARKYGLSQAKGQYVLQLDSDDYYSTDMIKALVSEAEKTGADITICDYYVKDKNSEEHVHVNPPLDPIECMKSVLTETIHSAVWNKLIRKDLYLMNNIWPTEGLNIREDFSVMYKLLFFSKKIAYVPQAFYTYVQRDGSYTHNSNQNRIFGETTALLISQMDEFCGSYVTNKPSLLNAFSFFVARNIILPILYVDDYRTKLAYIPLNFTHYLRTPYKLSVFTRLIGICNILHLSMIVKILKGIRKVIKNEV